MKLLSIIRFVLVLAALLVTCILSGPEVRATSCVVSTRWALSFVSVESTSGVTDATLIDAEAALWYDEFSSLAQSFDNIPSYNVLEAYELSSIELRRVRPIRTRSSSPNIGLSTWMTPILRARS